MTRKQPLYFRKEEVEFVTKRWKAQECCALIGVGSVGKSNLLHHIASETVQQHYIGQHTQKLKTIILDANLLGPLTDDKQFKTWAGYELMMHRLYMAFYPFDILDDDATHFYNTYRILQDGTNPLYAYMGLRYFELGLSFFLKRGWKIVFLFDEFEEFLSQMPSRFFQSLRGLRDTNKDSLLYLTFSREPMSLLVEKMGLNRQELEPFIELFNGNEYYVGPYNEVDSQEMLENLIKRHQSELSSELKAFLLQSSSGFAGLLKASFNTLSTIPERMQYPLNYRLILEKIVSRHAVQQECYTLWSGLSENEQSVLEVALGRKAYHSTLQHAVELLVQKRLLQVDSSNNLIIRPPMFDQYLRMKYV